LRTALSLLIIALASREQTKQPPVLNPNELVVYALGAQITKDAASSRVWPIVLCNYGSAAEYS